MFQNLIFHQLQVRALEIILLVQLHQLRAHKRALEIILLALQLCRVLRDQVRHDQVLHDQVRQDQVRQDQVHRVRKVDQAECQDRVRVLFVQVLQHDHNKDLTELHAHKVAEDLVEEVQLLLGLIVHKLAQHVLEVQYKQNLEQENQVVASHQEDLAHVREPAVHSEKTPERRRITRARKLVVKKSTIWQLQLWVEQLFLAVMEARQFVSVVALHLQISQRRLVQIPQR